MPTPPPDHAPFIQTTDHDVRLYTEYGGHHYWHQQKGWLYNFSAFDSCFPDLGERLDRYKIAFPTFEMYKEALGGHADTGTSIHGGMDKLNGGDTLLKSEHQYEVWKHLVTYVTCARKHIRDIIASEAVVYDLDRRIAGTLDCVAEVSDIDGVPDGSVAVLDAKKSKVPFSDNDVWLAAKVRVNEYGLEWNKRNYPQATHAALVRTNTKHRQGFEVSAWPLSDVYHELFECSRKLYTALRPDPSPAIPEELPDTLSLSSLHASASFMGAVAQNGHR